MSEFNFTEILSQRKDLDHVKFAYDLGGNQFGLDTAFVGDVDINREKMAVSIVYADGNRRDGVGDLLEVGGIDLSRHQSNPIHLFDHGKIVQLPVGRTVDPDTGLYTGTIDPVSKTARDLVFFWQGKGKGFPGQTSGVAATNVKPYEHALFCEQIFQMLDDKYLNGGSIGYQVKHARELYPDYESGTPKGLHLLSVLKLESSTVVLPANGDTVRKMLAMPAIAGKPPCHYFVKSLQPYAPEKKATAVSGFNSKAAPEIVVIRKESHPFKAGAFIYRAYSSDGFNYGIGRDSPEQTEQEFRKQNSHLGEIIFQRKAQPSDGIDPAKARQILKDGEANGKPLTEKQRGMFGAAAGKDAKALRKKYKIYQRRPGKPGGPAGLSFTSDDVAIQGRLKPGDTVTARDYLGGGEGPAMMSGMPGAAAKPGDRLEVLGWSDNGRFLQLRNKRNGCEFTADSGKVRKSLDGMQTKGLIYSVIQSLTADGAKIYRGGNYHVGDVEVNFFDNESQARSFAERANSVHRYPGIHFHIEKVDEESPQRKPTGEMVKTKSLGDVRKKYRSVKDLRRRLRKSAPGSSLVYVRGKDLDELKREAELKGLKAEQVGSHGDLEKVKLTGDDGAIDGVAKAFGHVKSLNGKLEKTMSDVRTKALDQDDAQSETPEQEPYGAQVLRAMHKHHSDALRDYDEMLGPLEQEHVKKHVSDHLGNIEKFLGGTEKLWSKHYKDLPPLEGVGEDEGDELEDEEKDLTEDEADKVEGELDDVKEDLEEETADVEAKDMDTMDDAAAPADSGEDFPDDLVEEDKEEMKSLNRRIKQLRGKYKGLYTDNWSVQQDEENSAIWYVVDKDGVGYYIRASDGPVKYRSRAKAEATADKLNAKNGKSLHKCTATQKGLCPACKEAGKTECDCGKSLNGKIKGAIGGAVGAGLGAVAGGPAGAVMGGMAGDELTGKDLHHVQEAGGYLSKLAEPESEFGEEDKFKSYHYHKTLEGMAQLGEAHDDLNQTPTADDIPNADFKPGAGAKDFASEEEAEGHTAPAGSEEWAEEEADEPEHKTKLMGASKFFKELSQTNDFGDPHRQQAGQHAKALNDMANGGQEEEEEDTRGEEDVFEPGEMGEKSVKDDDEKETNGKSEKALPNLFKQYKEQNQQVNGLLKTIDQLSKRLTV